jgi:hypothetical protein
MSSKTVAIIGASRHPEKFSHKAIKASLQSGYKVYPINPEAKEIAGLKSYANLELLPQPVKEISIYVPPAVTIGILQSLVDYPVEKIYLNPGSADDIVRDLATKLGLPVVEACSIRSQGYDPDML